MKNKTNEEIIINEIYIKKTIKQKKISLSGLTNKQREFIEIVENFKKENGQIPTIREICKITGYSSTATVFNKLAVLQKKGYQLDTKKEDI